VSSINPHTFTYPLTTLNAVNNGCILKRDPSSLSDLLRMVCAHSIFILIVFLGGD